MVELYLSTAPACHIDSTMTTAAWLRSLTDRRTEWETDTMFDNKGRYKAVASQQTPRQTDRQTDKTTCDVARHCYLQYPSCRQKNRVGYRHAAWRQRWLCDRRTDRDGGADATTQLVARRSTGDSKRYCMAAAVDPPCSVTHCIAHGLRAPVPAIRETKWRRRTTEE